MELKIDRLTKQYGAKIAVDRISLTLTPGVTGLLGANGAGKTTLMRMLCGILKPTSGTVSFDGVDVSTESYRRVLGYLPQDFGYYPNFTGLDFLLYLSALKGLDRRGAEARSRELLELVGLSEAARKKIKTYSGGMKQRLGIAQALLNHRRIGPQGAGPLPGADRGAGGGQHCAALHPHHLRCGADRRPDSDGAGRPAHL